MQSSRSSSDAFGKKRASMFRLWSIGVLFCLVLLECSCGNETVVLSIGGFELIQKGANSLKHQGGNLQLWHVSSSGKRSLVWGYVIGAPEVLDGLVVFAGGLTDDRRWKAYPALLAFAPDGPPVEITEMATRQNCTDQGIDYASVAGAYRYRIDSASQGVIRLSGMNIPESPSQGAWSIEVTVSRDGISKWVQDVRRRGIKKRYGGVEFIAPEVS